MAWIYVLGEAHQQCSAFLGGTRACHPEFLFKLEYVGPRIQAHSGYEHCIEWYLSGPQAKKSQKLWWQFTIQNRKECAAGEIFEDFHENLLERVSLSKGGKVLTSTEKLLESVESIHYPKGWRRCATQAKILAWICAWRSLPTVQPQSRGSADIFF